MDTLIAPDPGKAGGGAKLEHLGALTLCYLDGLLVAELGSGDIAVGVQQIAPHTVQLGFMTGVVCCLDDLLSLSQITQPLCCPAKPVASLAKQRECTCRI